MVWLISLGDGFYTNLTIALQLNLDGMKILGLAFVEAMSLQGY